MSYFYPFPYRGRPSKKEILKAKALKLEYIRFVSSLSPLELLNEYERLVMGVIMTAVLLRGGNGNIIM